MKKNEADRLRDIANELDDQCYAICNNDGYNRQAQLFHWAANKIRIVIMDGGFNGIIDAKYDKTGTTWQLDKEE